MNLFRKKLFILLLVVLFILAGCTTAKNNKSTEPTLSDTPDAESTAGNENEPEQELEEPHTENGTEKNDISPTDNGEDETIFEVKDSEQIKGWKQLTLKDYAYTTEDWSSFSYNDESPLIAYTLHFPDNWDIEYSVFTNEKGEKVAELFPPIIMTEGQSLLDNWETTGDCELISKEDIKVGDLNGARIVLKTYPHGGDIVEWYPYTYYLTDGKQAFAMSFYALELDDEQQKQFDGIIDSFSFLD